MHREKINTDLHLNRWRKDTQRERETERKRERERERERERQTDRQTDRDRERERWKIVNVKGGETREHFIFKEDLALAVTRISAENSWLMFGWGLFFLPRKIILIEQERTGKNSKVGTSLVTCSVTRFINIYFTTSGKMLKFSAILRVYLVFGKILNLFWPIFMLFS